MPRISNLNNTAASENVPEIQRQIRVSKEQARVIWGTLAFNKVPERIFIEMILFVFLWLNSFPPVGGISKTHSLITIIAYCNLYYSNHCVVKFGAYLEIHEDTPPANTITERSQGAIYLGTTTNFHGSCKFIILITVQRISRKQFTPLPMPQSVIKKF